MSKKKMIVMCLDAFDAATCDRLIAEGKLKGIAQLKADSARFALEHGEGGKARYTGLTWEHFSAGRTPDSVEKWSVISFDASKYRPFQTHATERPFFADLDANVVVFDAPYFNLRKMKNGVGVVGWGGHDTGAYLYAQPAGLLAEIEDKFGAGPDNHALNTMVYPDPDETRELAEGLVRSVKQRTDITKWLLQERSPDWDICVLGYGEPHDAIELLWHGVDPEHHLRKIESVAPAAKGVEDVYEAVSVSIEDMRKTFPEAVFVAFTMHGMGINDTDLPTMLFLPELLHKMQFGKNLFVPREDWMNTEGPALRPGENWNDAVIGQMNHMAVEKLKSAYWTTRWHLKNALGKTEHEGDMTTAPDAANDDHDPSFAVDWMPAEQYRRYWKKMDAFSTHAYFDGRVRVNLKGREANGTVELADYDAVLDRIETVLRDCRDIKTGEPIIKEISRPGAGDPMSMDETQSDLKIIWHGSSIGWVHPEIGQIGPAPVRRAGGHSGGYGALFVAGGDVTPGDYGLRSSFDVAPTIVDLFGGVRPNYVDGDSVFEALRERAGA